MRVLWTSPHCRPDWLSRLGEESQGGQTVVMNRLPHTLARVDPTIQIDILTRLQDNDPFSHQQVKFLDDDPQVRLIRLPCGPSDRYVPKEILYGDPIAEFVENISAWASQHGIRYDLLHGHYADGWEAVTLLKERWPHHPPALLTTHSLGLRKRKDGLERGEGTAEALDAKYNFGARISSEERSLSLADRILPLSTPEAEFLQQHYTSVQPGDTRLMVIPNGIDPRDFPTPPQDVRTRLRQELGVDEATFLLLVPSRVDPRKGQENMLQALAERRGALEKHSFRILFLAWPDVPTPYVNGLQSLIDDAGLSRWILTYPPVPHEQMPGFFVAADGVALPSQEYFSIAMLEAMLLERPLIVSTHSSGVDVITQGVHGFLVDHTQTTALGETVLSLLGMTPAEQQEMGRQARARILEGYTWERIAERTLEVYQGQVVGG